MRIPTLILALGALVCIGFMGCDEKGSTTTDCQSSVERSALLATAAERISFQLASLEAVLARFEEELSAFAAAPNVVALGPIHTRLEEVYLNYHALEPYVLVLDHAGLEARQFNAFPVDTALLLDYANAGELPAAAEDRFDRGLAAFDYLLYAGGDSAVVARLRSMAGSAALLEDLTGALSNATSAARTNWEQSGRPAFEAATGSEAGSGLSLLMNSYSKHFEDVRRDKLGLPFGVSLGFPTPNVVEAPYAGLSLRYLTESVTASQIAVVANNSSPTLDTYLAALSNAEGAELAIDIARQYQLALTSLDAVQEPLSAAVSDDRDDVQVAYNAISRQVVNLKTDAPALACVAITYVDNPSDSD